MTIAQEDTTLFETSSKDFLTWPRNLVNKDLYRPLLTSAEERFKTADNLFSTNEEPIIYFWDYDRVAGKFNKDKVCRNPDLPHDQDPDQKLKIYLGDQSVYNPQYARTEGQAFTKRDPQCRFIFLVSGHGRKPLIVTRRMFSRLMTYHQVSHTYVDYVTVFGGGERPRDLRFGGFSAQISFSPQGRAGKFDMLGRSGREYQVCYNLKAPADLEDGNWSIRQVAIHHQLDIENGRSLWVMTKGDDFLKKNVERLTGKNGLVDAKDFSNPGAAYRSSLAIHMMLAMWCSDMWRDYIAYFENEVEKDSGTAVEVPNDWGDSNIVYRPRHLQDIQYDQDKVRQAIIVMKLNIKTLMSLLAHLENVLKHSDTTLEDPENEEQLDVFRKRITTMIESLNLHISRAELMSQIIEDRKDLIIQHLQAQSTDNMGRLAAYAGADTIAMRIITVVTLIFLPATFVSTFFSTDIVKYQPNSRPMVVFSLLALERWLEVALPLTLVTLLVAFILYNRAMKIRQLELPRWEKRNNGYRHKDHVNEKVKFSD